MGTRWISFGYSTGSTIAIPWAYIRNCWANAIIALRIVILMWRHVRCLCGWPYLSRFDVSPMFRKLDSCYLGLVTISVLLPNNENWCVMYRSLFWFFFFFFFVVASCALLVWSPLVPVSSFSSNSEKFECCNRTDFFMFSRLTLCAGVFSRCLSCFCCFIVHVVVSRSLLVVWRLVRCLCLAYFG